MSNRPVSFSFHYTQINNSDLIKALMHVVEVIAVHVSQECAQCSARGFMCEMCDEQMPLYSFDIINVAACRGCNTFVHRRCIAASRACRRCKHLRDRKIQGSIPKVPSMQTAIGLLPGPGTVGGTVEFTHDLMSQQTQRLAHVVEERRRRRSSREQPFGHFPRDFGDSVTSLGKGKGIRSKDLNTQGQCKSSALQAERARASASISFRSSLLPTNLSRDSWGASAEDDMFESSSLDDSVSTGGPGDFAGLGGGGAKLARGRDGHRVSISGSGSGGGSDEWHWRTG